MRFDLIGWCAWLVLAVACNSEPSGSQAGSEGAGGAFIAGSGGTPAAGSGGIAPAGSGGTASAISPTGSGGGTASGSSAGTSGNSGSGGRGHAGGSGGSTPSNGTGGMRGSGGTGSGGRTGSGGAGGAGGTDGGNATLGPCDIYATGDTPCIAAHSTVRALYGAYDDKLYQVRRASDNTTKDIEVVKAGGFADATAQDAFCAGTTCVVTLLYDQSGHGNHLEYQGQGSSVGGQDKAASATSESLQVSGQKVYSLYINPGNSYWRDGHSTGVPTGSAPEGLYMVTSGTHVNGGCCFDYGNSETDRSADGAGAMDAIYFGTSCWFGGCSGSGPWVQADLEYGLYPGGSSAWNPMQMAFTSKYVTAMLKNDGTTRFALKGGNAQSGSLTTLWDGALPNGYSPMKKQGAIVLGSGGDCCARNTNQSLGTFYEGAIVDGYPSDQTETLVQDNIIAAEYGQ